ncbi:MAG: hypothetical protein QOF83_1555 [Solirubrobacteraceae bacterium]|jgi:hypothetical protein|nr:hypothetical protein [Solirubrobacteraceae bacterium]
MRRYASRWSAALCVGVVTLVIAGGGYAFASSGTGKIRACVQKHSHLVYTGKCKKQDKKLSWSSTGPRGPAGPIGAAGAKGATGASGPAGTARAYAKVFTGGTFDTARTKNFSAVTNPSTGIYCLTPSGVTEAGTAPGVSVDWGSSPGSDNMSAYWDSQPNDCPAGQFEVQTYEFAIGTDNTLSNNVAFTIVVP